MNQPHSINVSQERANEIFQGKASTAIKDLMVENATLTAVVEAAQEALRTMQENLATRELELRKALSTIDQLRLQPTPGSPSPQDTSGPV